MGKFRLMNENVLVIECFSLNLLFSTILKGNSYLCSNIKKE